MDIPTSVSVIVGTVSVAIALFAVLQANSAARESRENFRRTRDVLADIEKQAAVTESMVTESQRELIDTVRQIVLPEKPDIGEQLGVEYMRMLMKDPDTFGESVNQLLELAERRERTARE